jgi:hypothetical protein
MVVETFEDVKSNAVVNSDSAVYDIICYYKEESEDNKDDDNVHAVISKVNQFSNVTTKSFNHKQIMWQLFGCLLIIILLSSPIYGFATLYLYHRTLMNENAIIIWTPIIFSATYLLLTPLLFSPVYIAQFSNRSVILVSAFILSLAISISGVIFVYFNANFLLIVPLLYGVIGGKKIIYMPYLDHIYF